MFTFATRVEYAIKLEEGNTKEGIKSEINVSTFDWLRQVSLKTEFWSKLVKIGQTWSRKDIGHTESSD